MTFKIRVCLLLLVLAFACPVAASDLGGGVPSLTFNHGLSPALAEEIEVWALEEMAERGIPGMAIGVVQGHTLVLEGYYGYADVGSGRVVDEATMFRIASISKTMTAVGLMRLWEDGAFDLDDDINNYLSGPRVKARGEAITFRHLLTHTSGGGELISMRYLPVIYDGLVIRPLRKRMDYPPIAKVHNKHRMFHRVEPGAKWAYCNYGFVYLGAAIERMSNERFDSYMKERLLGPLGMTEASFVHDPGLLADAATGHLSVGDSHLPFSSFVWLNTPAAGVSTNVRDMAKYVSAMASGGANRDGRVLKPETVALMYEFHHTWDERQEGYGLGFRVYGENVWGRRVVGHGGNYMTQTSQMLIAPDDRVGVFAMSNSSRAPGDIAWGVLKRALGVSDEPPPAVAPSREVMDELAGYYGPEHRDLNTSMRLYMGGPRRYRVAEIDGDLVLIQTSRGKSMGKVLSQVGADDPYFFIVIDEDAVRPRYVSFKSEGGKLYIIPGGLSRYVRLGPARALAAKLTERW